MSSIQVRPFEEKDSEDWDRFIGESANGTLFHTRRFINYHPPGRFDDHSCLFFHKTRLLGLFPAALIQKENKKILKSHPGTSYGGLVVPENLGLETAFRLVENLEAHAGSVGADQLEFRSAPKIFNRRPCDQLEFALVKNGYLRKEEELSTCYFLPPFKDVPEEAVLKSFSQKTRNEARTGIKNKLEFLETKGEKEIKQFFEILRGNLKKHKTEPVHSVEEIIYLCGKLSDEVRIFTIRADGNIIGGFMVLRINGEGLHIFYSAIDYRFQSLRPMNYGLLQLMRFGARAGFRFLNYGISTEDGGNTINWNLFRFKESFGGHGILRTYWGKSLK